MCHDVSHTIREGKTHAYRDEPCHSTWARSIAGIRVVVVPRPHFGTHQRWPHTRVAGCHVPAVTYERTVMTERQSLVHDISALKSRTLWEAESEFAAFGRSQ